MENNKKNMKVYIWGAGYYANYVYSIIDKDNCQIEGIIDSDNSKQGMEWNNKLPILSPEEIAKCDFDYIIISVQKYEEIESDCVKLNVPREKVISYWKDTESIGLFENRSYQILKERQENEILQIRWNNAPYEFGLNNYPKIRSAQELLNKIIIEKSSLCRFGDGEYEIIRGNKRPWFQMPNDNLARKLRIVLKSQNDKILIAIADNLGNLDKYTEKSADNMRKYLAKGTRDVILNMLDLKRTYWDAYVSRPYLIYKDKHNAEMVFALYKKLWKDRDLLIVEGCYSRLGMGNDLFAECYSVRRIICPQQNCFDYYDDIINSVIKNANSQTLVIISLGPTATVMAYDLAVEGLQALDIGQIDTEYEWYLRGVNGISDIPRKCVAELKGFYEPKGVVDKLYEKQIIDRIGI